MGEMHKNECENLAYKLRTQKVGGILVHDFVNQLLVSTASPGLSLGDYKASLVGF